MSFIYIQKFFWYFIFIGILGLGFKDAIAQPLNVSNPSAPIKTLSLKSSSYSPWVKSHSLDDLIALLVSDLHTYYSPLFLSMSAGSIALSGSLAFTNVDQSVYHSFNKLPKSTNDIFNVGSIAFFPLVAGTWVVDIANIVKPNKYFNVVGYYGEQLTRAFVVSYPSVFVLQHLLGSSRPNNGHNKSHWFPMRDSYGISNRVYFSTLPWATLTFMTKNPWIITGSTVASLGFATLSLHSNAYLSQSVLGLAFAYLGAFSVSRSNTLSSVHVMPIVTSTQVGIGVSIY